MVEIVPYKVAPNQGRCEKCGGFKADGDRFCSRCAKEVLAILRPQIWPIPPSRGRYRTAEMKENIRETKYGVEQ